MENIETQKGLMEIKELVAELHNTILDLSAGLWELNTKAEDMLMREVGVSAKHEEYDKIAETLDANIRGDDKPVVMPPKSDDEPVVVRARGRPRKEVEPQAQEPPKMTESPKEARIPATEPDIPPKAPETPQKEPRMGIVERLLGRDASEKQRQRGERMAQLEKELAELNRVGK